MVKDAVIWRQASGNTEDGIPGKEEYTETQPGDSAAQVDGSTQIHRDGGGGRLW